MKKKWRTNLKTRLVRLPYENFFQFLDRQKKLLFPIFSLTFFSGILLIALVPVQYNFESRLLVNQLSFVNKEPDSLFINRIRGIKEITITGVQKNELTLNGQFSGIQIDNTYQLDIELPYEYSKIIFRPNPSEVSIPVDMELTEVYLQDETIVNELRYAPSSQTLSFQLVQNLQNSGALLNKIRIFMGNHPLQLVLEGYRLPQMGMEDPEGSAPLTILYLPDIKDLELTLPVSSTVSMKLPNFSDSEIDSRDWFWGDFQVEDVKFSQERRIGLSIDEELVLSTIQEGVARMADQELKIEADQFLIAEEPGVERLRQIKIQNNKGLDVRASGRTKKLQVGFDPNFPIRELSSNFFMQFLPRDLVIALISFSSAMAASLLPWIAENLFTNSKNKSED
ncbi:hypothetical protein C8B47_01910 [filamentous cyanobacterium CCP4]|nr:hypothetical protein C8B47_01910 [filamentous cyanobacterium CCP4]